MLRQGLLLLGKGRLFHRDTFIVRHDNHSTIVVVAAVAVHTGAATATRDGTREGGSSGRATPRIVRDNRHDLFVLGGIRITLFLIAAIFLWTLQIITLSSKIVVAWGVERPGVASTSARTTTHIRAVPTVQMHARI